MKLGQHQKQSITDATYDERTTRATHAMKLAQHQNTHYDHVPWVEEGEEAIVEAEGQCLVEVQGMSSC